MVTRVEDDVIEKRHCGDHSGTITKQTEQDHKIDSNFATVKWLLAAIAAAILSFGAYLLGAQTALDKTVTVNSHRITNVEKQQADTNELKEALRDFLAKHNAEEKNRWKSP